jgi:hypothetical protein
MHHDLILPQISHPSRQPPVYDLSAVQTSTLV